MKAMILAAGLGSRMRPLTDHTPKPLLTVHGKPLIVHTINALAASGIEDIVINVYHHAQQIMNYLEDGARYGVKIVYSVEPELLDTGGGIKRALPLLGDDPFLAISADIYTAFSMAPLQTKFAKNNLLHLVMVDNPEFHLQGDYCLLQDGRLALGKKKVEEYISKGTESIPKSEGYKTLTYANIGLLSPKLFSQEMLAIVKPRGEKFPLRLLFDAAIAAGRATGEYYSGAWYNIGTPEMLATVNK